MPLAFRLFNPAIWLAAILPVAAGAQQSRFDIDDLTLYIPCLEVLQDGASLGPGGGQVMYEVFMAFNGKKFVVENLSELDAAEQCLATFDLATDELVDQVRHRDNIYNVVLHHDGNLGFSPGAVSFRERGYTSLWRVTNGLNEVFIGGTIHILNIGDFPLPDLFTKALARSTVLYTEVAYEESDQTGDGSDTGENPAGTLTEVLSPSTLAQLNAFLDARGVTIEPIDKLLPYLAGRALIQLALSADGYGPGVDYFFSRVAEGVGLPNLGLETPGDQVAAIDTAFEGVSADDLILSALFTAEDPAYRDYLDFIIDAWREGEIGYFEWANDQTKAEDEDYYNAILRDRNLAWLPQIIEMLETPETELVLVGVGHLAGDDNVLALLEEAGYTIERFR